MLTYAAPKGFAQWLKLYTLYRCSFPRAERKPLAVILRMHRQGAVDVWYFTKNGQFAGFVITLNGDYHILLDYLVVNPPLRGHGTGSEILRLIHEHYHDKGIFLEIESAYEDCKNKAERLRRKHFYEKCGMTSMELFVWLFGIKMELMSFGCKMTYEEYVSFYRNYYGQWSTAHIQKAEK